MEERPIGERFHDCGLIYEVRESDSCAGCSFYYAEEAECTMPRRKQPFFGPCTSNKRRDGKNVVFMYAGEVP